MADFFGLLIILVVYFGPLLVILYFLSKALIFLIMNMKSSLDDDVEEALPFLKTKIAFTLIGIIYCLFIFVGIIFMLFQPTWFNPPIWLKIISIVLLVPYFACALGLIGLGNIGRSGFSPWTDFKNVLKEIRR